MSQVDTADSEPRLAADTAIVKQYLDQAAMPEQLDSAELERYRSQVKKLMVEKNARLVAHYYTDSLLQDLAEESDGFVGDSLGFDNRNRNLR